MGTFLSGAKARLIFTGGALGAAHSYTPDRLHMIGEAVSSPQEAAHG